LLGSRKAEVLIRNRVLRNGDFFQRSPFYPHRSLRSFVSVGKASSSFPFLFSLFSNIDSRGDSKRTKRRRTEERIRRGVEPPRRHVGLPMKWRSFIRVSELLAINVRREERTGRRPTGLPQRRPLTASEVPRQLRRK